VGREVEVLVDDVSADAVIGRTHREAPEIDGVVHLHAEFAKAGAVVRAHVTEAIGPDLVAKARG
jgi:ribosomal protein S12 methylthiotransferase